jgi:hypothetical protein
MRSAREWLESRSIAGYIVGTDQKVTDEEFIAQVQREAVEACAKECDSIAIGASDDPDMWSAADCADACRALLPKETP